MVQKIISNVDSPLLSMVQSWIHMATQYFKSFLISVAWIFAVIDFQSSLFEMYFRCLPFFPWRFWYFITIRWSRILILFPFEAFRFFTRCKVMVSKQIHFLHSWLVHFFFLPYSRRWIIFTLKNLFMWPFGFLKNICFQMSRDSYLVQYYGVVLMTM